jgi:ketosteroid isomerase-like protein
MRPQRRILGRIWIVDGRAGGVNAGNLPLACSPRAWDDLNVKRIAVVAAIFLLAMACAAACPKNQAKTEAALEELEQAWAAALGRHDASTVACMLADEFEEADVDGALHTRAEVLEHIPERKPGSNRLTELRAHVDGNFGYVRGLNEVGDPTGRIIRARVRFTDVFTYRDGRWQAILAHESLIGEASR